MGDLILAEVQSKLKEFSNEESYAWQQTGPAAPNTDSYFAGEAAEVPLMAQIEVASLPEQARCDIDAVNKLQAITAHGHRCLRALYLHRLPDGGGKGPLKIMEEVEEFQDSAAEQIVYVFASMLAPDATTVLCSTVLQRAITELLSVMLSLDALRMLKHVHLGGGRAKPMPAAIRPQQISKAAGLRAILSQHRAKKVLDPSAPPLSEAPCEEAHSKSVEVVFEPTEKAAGASSAAGLEVESAAVEGDASENMHAFGEDAASAEVVQAEAASEEQQTTAVAEQMVSGSKGPKFLSFWRRSKRSEPGTPRAAADSPRIAAGNLGTPLAGLPAASGTPGSSLISACTDKPAVPSSSSDEQESDLQNGELQNAISLDKVALAEEQDSSCTAGANDGNTDDAAGPSPSAGVAESPVQSGKEALPDQLYPALETSSKTPIRVASSKGGFAMVSEGQEQGQEDLQPLDPAARWAEFTAEPWLAIHELSARLQAVPYHPVLLAHLVRFLLRAVMRKGDSQPMLARDRSSAARALCAALYLLFPDGQESEEAEPITPLSKKKLLKSLHALRHYPVVPAFAELPLCLTSLLQFSPYLVSLGSLQGREWQITDAEDLDGKALVAAERRYNMVEHALSATNLHNLYEEAFMGVALQVEEHGSSLGGIPIPVANKALELALVGISCLSMWKHQLLDMQAWRALRASTTSPDEAGPSSQAVGYSEELRAQELEAMQEMLACLKGLGALLASAAAWMQPLAHRAMHAQLQNFVQVTATGMLKPSVPAKVQESLLRLRTAVGNWAAGQSPPQKRPSRSRGFTTALRTSLLAGRFRAAGTGQANDEGVSFLDALTSKSVSALRGGLDGLMPAVVLPPLEAKLPFEAHAVPPSPVQLHYINQALEEILRQRESTGLRSPFGAVGLSSNKAKEVSAVNQMLLQWEVLLDMHAAISQESDLSGLVLHEFTAAAPLPVDRSLPLRLGMATLELPAGGPMEVCLLPLQLYGDAARAAQGPLQAPHLLPDIADRAQACLDLLVARAAQQVFAHYKAQAASVLTDPVAARGGLSLPPLPVPRVFSGLFRLHSMPLLDRCVDVAGQLAARVNQLFKDNASYLVSRYEAAGVASLVEAEALVYTLHYAHAMLQPELVLDDWDVLWRAADGPPSLHEYTSRTAHHTIHGVLSSLAPTFTYCSATRRFVPGSKTAEPGELPAAVEEAFLWGPGGSLSAAFGQWAAAHAGFFGSQHLQALQRWAGGAGVARLAMELEQHIIALLQTSLSASIAEVRERMQKVVVQLSGWAFSDPRTGFAAYRRQLVKALGSEGQKEVLLRQLAEVGNCYALLVQLNDTIDLQQTQAFMQLAPAVGIVPTPEDNLARQVSSNGSLGMGPLQRAAQDFKSWKHSQLASSHLASALSSADADALVGQVISGGWGATEMSSVMPQCLARIRQALSTLSLAWQEPLAQAHHAISAAIFTLCLPPPGRSEAATPREASKQRGVPSSEWDVRGDGAALGGFFLVHLLEQKASFQLQDYSRAVLQAAAFEPSSRFDPELQAFLQQAGKAERLRDATFATMERALPTAQPAIIVESDKGRCSYAPDAPPMPAPWVQTDPMPPLGVAADAHDQLPAWHCTKPSEAVTSLTSPSPSALWAAAAHERQATAYASPTCSPHQPRSMSGSGLFSGPLSVTPADLPAGPGPLQASPSQPALPFRGIGQSPVPASTKPPAGAEAAVEHQSPYPSPQRLASGVTTDAVVYDSPVRAASSLPLGAVVYESPVPAASGGAAGAVLYESPQRAASSGGPGFFDDLKQLQSSAPEWPASYMSPAEVPTPRPDGSPAQHPSPWARSSIASSLQQDPAGQAAKRTSPQAASLQPPAAARQLAAIQDGPRGSPLGPYSSPLRPARSGSLHASPVLDQLRATFRQAQSSPVALPSAEGDTSLPPRVPALNLAARRFGSSPARASALSPAEQPSVRLQLIPCEGSPKGRALAASIVLN